MRDKDGAHPQTGTIADDLTATCQWSVDPDNFFAVGVADGGVQVDFVATVTGPIPEVQRRGDNSCNSSPGLNLSSHAP